MKISEQFVVTGIQLFFKMKVLIIKFVSLNVLLQHCTLFLGSLTFKDNDPCSGEDIVHCKVQN